MTIIEKCSHIMYANTCQICCKFSNGLKFDTRDLQGQLNMKISSTWSFQSVSADASIHLKIVFWE